MEIRGMRKPEQWSKRLLEKLSNVGWIRDQTMQIQIPTGPGKVNV